MEPGGVPRVQLLGDLSSQPFKWGGGAADGRHVYGFPSNHAPRLELGRPEMAGLEAEARRFFI